MISKIFKGILFLFIAFVIAFNAWILFSGKWFIYKAIRYNFVNIDDYKIFKNNTITKSDSVVDWPFATKYNQFIFSDQLNTTLKETQTVAFLVIKNDSVVIENYWDEYAADSISNSFSMAKTAVALMIGAAIKDGLIKNVDQPVGDFIPEFKEGAKSNITIKHLLMMSSGLRWDESKSYANPLQVFMSDIMEAYYGDDLYKKVIASPVAYTPGKYFDYSSQDSQILAFIIMKASGKSLSAYFEEKIWKPIGAKNNAKWCLDEKGNERSFCCLNSNARDFAKLGKLMINKGFANGMQVIDTTYINEMQKPIMLKNLEDTTKMVDFYGYQTWLMNDIQKNVSYFRGTLGQMILMLPEKNIIIVHLGKWQGSKSNNHYTQSVVYVEEVGKIIDN